MEQMKNNKLFVALLVGGLEFFGASVAQGAELYTCKVEAVVPQTANFFHNGGRIPVGDEITLDLAAPCIEDLTFKSGHYIALKQTNSKLTLKVTEEGFFQYTGTHQGSLGFYTGRLFGYKDKQTAGVSIQVLQDDLYNGLALHSLSMSCKALSPN